MDIVVTVPKTFRYGGKTGLAAWIAEGCLPGENSQGMEYVFFSGGGARPKIVTGDRVYVVCEGFIRGYAPLVRCNVGYGLVLHFIRSGGAVAVTPAGQDGKPLPVQGFRGWRYVWWDRSSEIPFPDWQTYGSSGKTPEPKQELLF